MIGLNKTMAVYVPNGTDGAFDSLVGSHPCRLVTGGRLRNQNDERSVQAGEHLLLHEADVILPNICRLVISGRLYAVVDNTQEDVTGLTDNVIYVRCYVVRVDQT